MSGLLGGNVALVTGTGGRQRTAIASLFAADGAAVVSSDIHTDAAEATHRLATRPRAIIDVDSELRTRMTPC